MPHIHTRKGGTTRESGSSVRNSGIRGGQCGISLMAWHVSLCTKDRACEPMHPRRSNCSGCPQLVDLILAVPQLTEHLVCMLTEERRRPIRLIIIRHFWQMEVNRLTLSFVPSYVVGAAASLILPARGCWDQYEQM